VPVARR